MALPVARREVSPEPNTWDPFDELDRLSHQLRSWSRFGGPGISGAGFTPLVDIEETDDAYVAELDLPGVRRDDVNVELSGRRLVVRGERKEKERKGVLRSRTRWVGQFHYEIALPGEIDPEKVEARMGEGTLEVRVPKALADRARKISVK
jgi:HSP20 family protein